MHCTFELLTAQQWRGAGGGPNQQFGALWSPTWSASPSVGMVKRSVQGFVAVPSGSPKCCPKIRALLRSVQKSQLTHRVEIFAYFMSAQRWVLGGNSTRHTLANTQ